MSHNHIELFTARTCPDCAILKRWLEAQGLLTSSEILVNRGSRTRRAAEPASALPRSRSSTGRRCGDRRQIRSRVSAA